MPKKRQTKYVQLLPAHSYRFVIGPWHWNCSCKWNKEISPFVHLKESNSIKQIILVIIVSLNHAIQLSIWDFSSYSDFNWLINFSAAPNSVCKCFRLFKMVLTHTSANDILQHEFSEDPLYRLGLQFEKVSMTFWKLWLHLCYLCFLCLSKQADSTNLWTRLATADYGRVWWVLHWWYNYC